MTYTNRLDRPTVAHLHGGVTRPESDGFPTDTVAPGETRSFRYDNTGRRRRSGITITAASARAGTSTWALQASIS